jgi:hypothetical protein
MQARIKRADITLDFKKAFWTPPLAAREAYDLESYHIRTALDASSLVSLTDHDNIEAPSLLRAFPETAAIPISMEWTLPFRKTEFHLGVHNLPPARAEIYVEKMKAITATPSELEMDALLAQLDSHPEVLVVFNHPLWDLKGIGAAGHAQHLEAFLRSQLPRLHAFEINGMRMWEENRRARELAQRWGKIAVSGGDRHGVEPNTVLNLTNAGSFSEFVSEIRDGRSHILFLPQYGRPMSMRVIQSVVDVVRFSSNHALGERWDDRTFHPGANGDPCPLSALWRRQPGFINAIFSVLRLVESCPLRQFADLFVPRAAAQIRLHAQREEGA